MKSSMQNIIFEKDEAGIIWITVLPENLWRIKIEGTDTEKDNNTLILNTNLYFIGFS